MIDNIHAYYIPRNVVQGDESQLRERLDKYYIKEGGRSRHYIDYRFKNLVLRVYTNEFRPLSRIKLIGSLTKYVYGHNARNADPLTVKRAVAKLKKVTGLPIENFIVTYLEIGVNINVQHPVKEYQALLDYAPRLKKKFYKNTLYFQNTARTIKIYDKVKDAKKKKYQNSNLDIRTLPKNLLRFEVTVKKPTTEFKNDIFQIKNLYKTNSKKKNTIVYNDLVDKIKYRYFEIYKTNNTDLSKVAKPKDFIYHLASIGLKQYGGLDGVMKQLKKWRKNGNIPKHYPSKIKEHIENMSTNPTFIPNTHIKELDNLFTNLLEDLMTVYKQ
jgi:replication protein CRI